MSLDFFILTILPRGLWTFNFSLGEDFSLWKISLSPFLAAFRSEKWVFGSLWSLFDTTKNLKPRFYLQECVKNKTNFFNFWFVFNLLKETNEERRKTEIREKGGVGN